MLASVFGAIAVIAAGITIVILSRWRRAAGARSSLDQKRKQFIAEL
jgi:hypothetical protein